MLLITLVQLLRTAGFGHSLAAAALVGVVAGALMLAGPALKPLGNLNLVIVLVCLVVATVLAGVPIAFCLDLPPLGYLALTMRVLIMTGRMDEGMSHLILLAVPLFIFLGSLIEMTGVAGAMIRLLPSLLGHVQGGLSCMLAGAMYLVPGISGAKAADMASVAPVLFPKMQERGARPDDPVALLSAPGVQTNTVPPSLVLITIGSVTGRSIGALFTGGLLPGASLVSVLCGVVWCGGGIVSRICRVCRSSMDEETGRAFVIALPAFALRFLIRASPDY